ncbi:hypothetical protein [Paramicrobacterium chengjingii]|nr:hypothetical protein [Microbacterium chengjingii]
MLLLALELVARHIPMLRDGVLRLRLMWIATIALSAVVVVLTWQAMIGQSIVARAGAILVAGCAMLLGTIIAIFASVQAARAVESRVSQDRLDDAIDDEQMVLDAADLLPSGRALRERDSC